MTLRLALAACLALGAYAQATQPSWSSTAITIAVPDTANVPAEVMTKAVYSSLLGRFERNEAQADRLEAAGKDPLHRTRKWLQLQTGLTDQEFALVRPILLDAISSTNAKKAEVQAALDQAQKDNGGEPIIRQQGTKPLAPHKPAVPLTAAQKQAIGALNMQWEQVLPDHLQQIEKALGPSRFQQFDQAIRTLPGQSIKVVPLTK
jgi:hypothetical protein